MPARHSAPFDAHSRAAAYIFPRAHRIVRNFVARLYFRQIDRLDGCYLSAMGLTRTELDFLCTLPLDLDPWPELFRRRVDQARHTRSATVTIPPILKFPGLC